MNNKAIGIEIVTQTHGIEVAANMQQNLEDVEVLEQIGSVGSRLSLLHSCKLTTNHPSSNGQPILVADGIAYRSGDMTPAGVVARELISGNFNSINMDLPSGMGRCAFSDLFCRS